MSTGSSPESAPAATPLRTATAASVGEAFSASFDSYKSNVGTMMIGIFLFVLVGWVPLVNFVFIAGLQSLYLKMHRRESIGVGEVFAYFPKFLPLLIGGVLTAILILVGTLFFVLPGILAALMLIFVPLLIVDKNLDGIEAITTSYRITSGLKLQLFLFLLTCSIAMSIVSLVPFVGFLVALFGIYPVTLGGIVYFYESVSDQA